MITASQTMALEKLISGFTEVDNEQVYQRTGELDKDVELNDIEKMIKSARMYDVDPETLQVAMESVEFQEKASAAIWDLLTIVAQYERARMITEHREAA